jgi:uncharacterized protein
VQAAPSNFGVKHNRDLALYWYRRGSSGAASNIGTVWRDEGKLGRAITWFQRAVKLGDGDANLEIAKILLRKEGQVGKAIAYLKRTTKAKPSHVTEGSKQEARRLLSQLVRKKSPEEVRG